MKFIFCFVVWWVCEDWDELKDYKGECGKCEVMFEVDLIVDKIGIIDVYWCVGVEKV